MNYLTDAFKAMDMLNEEAFDPTPEGAEELSDFLSGDIDDTVDIIDPNAETEEELEDSYVGKIILDCCVCHSKLYKDKDEITLDEEAEIANPDEECPFCYSTEGFKIIGEVTEVEPEDLEETDEVEVKAEKGGEKVEVETEVKDELGEAKRPGIKKSRRINEAAKQSFVKRFLEKKNESADKTSKTDRIDAKRDDKVEKAKKALAKANDDADSLKDMRKKRAKAKFEKELDDADADRDDEKKAIKEDYAENGMVSFDLNTGIVPIIDASQYDTAIEFPQDADYGEGEYQDMWDDFIIEEATPFIEDLVHFTDKNIKVSNVSYFHPKAYNYSSDEINFTLTLSADLLNHLISEYTSNRDFIDFISKHYRGYSGFISYMASDEQELMEQNEKEPDRTLAQIIVYNAKDHIKEAQELFEYTVLEDQYNLDLHWIDEDDGLDESLNEEIADYVDTYRGCKLYNSGSKFTSYYMGKSISSNTLEGIKGKIEKAQSEHDKKYKNLPESKTKKCEKEDKECKEKCTDEACDKKDMKKNEGLESIKINTGEQEIEVKAKEDGSEYDDDFGDSASFGTGEEEISPIDDPDALMNEIESDEETPADGEDTSIDAETEESGENEDDPFADMEDVEVSEEEETEDTTKQEKLITRRPRTPKRVNEEIDGVTLNTGEQEIEVTTRKLDNTDETFSEDTEENSIDVDVDEIDEESFNSLGEKFLTKTYGNVKSYRTTSATSYGNKLKLEGVIRFASGKQKKTSFIFESKDITRSGKARFIGENVELSRGHRAFTVSGRMSGGKFIPESLSYRYKAKDKATGTSQKVFGSVKI